MRYLEAYKITSSPHLENTLDWDNGGLEKDLVEIANHLTEWEVKLVIPLGLTYTDKCNIKLRHKEEPVLQR